MKLYKSEYILKEGQKLIVRTPEEADGTYADEYFMCLFLKDRDKQIKGSNG